MINEKICGTYWLVAMPDGSKFITQGSKPRKNRYTWSKHSFRDMPWLFVEGDSSKWGNLRISKTNKGDIVGSSNYSNINFPDITFDDDPMEIEIGKSGRVYTYES